MIRPTLPEDTLDLLRLTEQTGLFLPIDMQALEEVLTDYHAEAAAQGHHCVSYVQDGEVIGFTYYAPTPMTDRTWHLWWIVVKKNIQARGVGSQLLRHAEEGARAENGRLMIVETSGIPTYELTRRFYLKHGYERAAALPDFYADGHDMVIFRKRLSP